MSTSRRVVKAAASEFRARLRPAAASSRAPAREAWLSFRWRTVHQGHPLGQLGASAAVKDAVDVGKQQLGSGIGVGRAVRPVEWRLDAGRSRRRSSTSAAPGGHGGASAPGRGPQGGVRDALQRRRPSRGYIAAVDVTYQHDDSRPNRHVHVIDPPPPPPGQFPAPGSLYRRELPPSCIAFASPEGRDIFTEALAEGGMESYFHLAEQFRTQKEPAYCALTTLTVVLNALSIDPGRGWKGPWRWYHEGMLDTCTPLAVVKQSGITLDRFVCLAEANGAASTLTRADASSEDELRELITRVSRATPEPEPVFLVASYSRKVLGQTGDGHMSPIAGVHTGRDLALILDVARFKYPPHWVPIPLLYEAMRATDKATGLSRGWVTLAPAPPDRPEHQHNHPTMLSQRRGEAHRQGRRRPRRPRSGVFHAVARRILWRGGAFGRLDLGTGVGARRRLAPDVDAM